MKQTAYLYKGQPKGADRLKTVKNEKLNIVNPGDKVQLALKALEVFQMEAQRAFQQTEHFTVAISGGHTPKDFYDLIGSTEDALSLPWDRIQLFWVDERCVPTNSELSNFKLAADTFLPKIPIPQQNVHRIPADTSSYIEAVSSYEHQIRDIFSLAPGQIPEFDLMILGMGADGHIGSLLPNSYALFNTESLVSVVYRMDEGLNRITLTYPVMCAAKHLMVLISGPEKARIVKDVLLGEPDEVRYPVHRLWPILDKVTWLIDDDAAAEL